MTIATVKKADLRAPLAKRALVFHCAPCNRTWDAEPGRIEDAPELEHHPWRYFAVCSFCGAEAGQAGWQRALLKGWARATGPRTPEGKAAVTRNLAGHPTPEEALRTRFNGMKHGLSAKVATYFPAKPDGYSFCTSCEVDRDWCEAQPACVKQAQTFLLHHAAFESRDPKVLNGVYAQMHAAIFTVLQQILQTIIADGVKIVAPQYISHEGEVIVAKFLDEHGKEHVINDIQAHPLFKPLAELLTRTGLSLSDMGMTNRVIEADEDELGRLTQATAVDQEAESEYLRARTDSMKALREMLERARAKTDTDPALLEYRDGSAD